MIGETTVSLESRRRILFIAEAVTLAHVARPAALAAALDPNIYDVHFAHSPRYRALLGEISFTEHRIDSIAPEDFRAALAAGRPVYDLATLKAYVERDLELLEQLRLDMVVGDFRLSLAVSAELAGIPYLALTNACWSPYTQQRYPVPELPLTRLLGPTLAQGLFSLARPFAFALHSVPMHRLRKHYGLPSLGFDLREVYTHADLTLYSDLEGLYQTRALPAHHHFIGPVIWSPSLPLPDWWANIPEGRPIVYVTLGSSGQSELLPLLIAALAALEVTALVSTAGAQYAGPVPENVYLESYLPGEAAVGRASLVICNGGSPTTQQALAQGVPVLGIADNLDQYLNMTTVETAGAGRLLRAGRCNARRLSAAITQLLADPRAAEAAAQLAGRIANGDSGAEFNRIVAAVGL